MAALSIQPSPVPRLYISWGAFRAFESFSLKEVQLSTLHLEKERKLMKKRLLKTLRKKLFGSEGKQEKQNGRRWERQTRGDPFNAAQGGSISPIRQREQPLGHAGTRFRGRAHRFRIGIHLGSRRPTRSQPSTGMQSRSRPPPPRLDWARYWPWLPVVSRFVVGRRPPNETSATRNAVGKGRV